MRETTEREADGKSAPGGRDVVGRLERVVARAVSTLRNTSKVVTGQRGVEQ